MAVGLDLDDCVLVSPEEREETVRLVREAVGNAARHGHARRVDVRLRGGEQRELLIADDGSGFDPTCLSGRSAGFGLTSMRERAERLGGRLELDAAPGHGTRVGVRWRG